MPPSAALGPHGRGSLGARLPGSVVRNTLSLTRIPRTRAPLYTLTRAPLRARSHYACTKERCLGLAVVTSKRIGL